MGLNSQDRKEVSMIICESDNSFFSCPIYLDTINPRVCRKEAGQKWIKINSHVTHEMSNIISFHLFTGIWKILPRNMLSDLYSHSFATVKELLSLYISAGKFLVFVGFFLFCLLQHIHLHFYGSTLLKISPLSHITLKSRFNQTYVYMHLYMHTQKGNLQIKGEENSTFARPMSCSGKRLLLHLYPFANLVWHWKTKSSKTDNPSVKVTELKAVSHFNLLSTYLM